MPSQPSSSLSFPTKLEGNVAWSNAQTGAPVELSKAQLKELRTIGHKVERFLAARGHWWRHSARLEPSALPSWARAEHVLPPGELAGEGLFACAFVDTEVGFKLLSLVVAQEDAARLAGLWQRVDSEAPRSLPGALAVPADANTPLWLALLRLRPLRDFWDRELRRAAVDALLQLLPDAWVLDPAPIPEGAVIPRLNLAAWSDLPRWRSAGRSFVIAAAESARPTTVLDPHASAPDWTDATGRALHAFAAGPHFLIDLTAGAPGGRPVLIGFYEKKIGRVECLGAMALIPGADGTLVPARVTTP